MKKFSFAVIGAIFLLIVSGIILKFSHSDESDSKMEYQTINIRRQSIEQTVTATGIIKPRTGAEVKVGAQVSGIVKKLYVSIGSKVKTGQILAEIEPAAYQAKVEMARAQEEIAETEKKYTSLDYMRSRTLFENGAITKQQLETAEKLYNLASSRLEQASADLDYAGLQLNFTKIISPIDGIVSSVTTQEGETVTSSFASPTFVTIIDLNRLELWAYVDETDIGRITNGQAVAFTIDTYPGEEFSGWVEAVYPKAEIQNNVVNYITVININKKDGRIIRPEMTASVRITNGRRDNILSVPKSFVKKEDGKTFIYVLKGSRPEKRFITLGISDKKYFEVVSGISENEKVISSDISVKN